MALDFSSKCVCAYVRMYVCNAVYYLVYVCFHIGPQAELVEEFCIDLDGLCMCVCICMYMSTTTHVRISPEADVVVEVWIYVDGLCVCVCVYILLVYVCMYIWLPQTQEDM